MARSQTRSATSWRPGGNTEQDRTAQPGAVGSQVEGEQPDGEALQHQPDQRGRQAHRAGGQAIDEVPYPLVAAEVLGQLAAGHLEAEPVVEEVRHLLGVAGDGVDQVGDLADQQRPHRGHEQHDGNGERGEDHGGGRPSPPASAGEEVDRRLDGEGEEERDQQQHQQAAQPHQQPERDDQRSRAEQQQGHVPGGPAPPWPPGTTVGRFALLHRITVSAPGVRRPHPGRVKW
jgi:hypothetical protein